MTSKGRDFWKSPTGLFVGSEKHLFEHRDRVHPVYFSYAFNKIDNINTQLPKAWSVEVLRKPIHGDAKTLEYIRQSRRFGRECECSAGGKVRFDARAARQVWSTEEFLPDGADKRPAANRPEAKQRRGE